ncbi:hypothetical protein C0J52_25068, partial [Blattella germanica]
GHYPSHAETRVSRAEVKRRNWSIIKFGRQRIPVPQASRLSDAVRSIRTLHLFVDTDARPSARAAMDYNSISPLLS